MDDKSTLNESGIDTYRSGSLRLHDAVCRREPGRPEAAISPEELLAQFRAADPTRNAACLPWLLRTYDAEGYRLEDLSKAHDTLAAFTRLRGLLPNTAIIDGETRNPRKLGSHMTLASLWSVIAPFVEAERLAQEKDSSEQEDTDKERALSQSRVIHRSNRMVVAVPMAEEASCWWGQGTQWCTAARNNNAFEEYHSKAPLIIVCLRKSGDLPARKLQLYVHASDMQFMDENDAPVPPVFIIQRWHEFKALVHWAVGRNGQALQYVPDPLRTEVLCRVAVGSNGWALRYVPEHLRTEAMCLAAVTQYGQVLRNVPESLRTEAICTVAVDSNGMALGFVPNPLRTEAMCITAVSRNGLALEFVPEPLRTEALCLAAVGNNGIALYHIPKPLRTEAMCLTAITQCGCALTHVPEHLRTEAICLAAIGRDGRALEHVPEHLCTEAICLAAIGSNGLALKHVPKLVCTEAICKAAVDKDGWALAYVPEPLRTEAMCLAAVGRYGQALLSVPVSLRTEVICATAVGMDRLALQFVPKSLRAEARRLIALGRDKQKAVSSEANERKSHDLVLAGLENYLNELQPS